MVKRVLLVLFLMSLSSAAFAGLIRVGEPPCTGSDQIITTLDNGFSFTPLNPNPSNGDQGTFGFCNETGQGLTSLVVGIRTTLTPSQVSCDSGPFEICYAFTYGADPGDLFIAFTYNPLLPGPPPPAPVPNNDEFTISLSCEVGDVCLNPWPTTPFEGSAGVNNNPANLPHVPEPASLVLLGSGIAAGMLRRKMR
jgi:PEP-CTERM motif